MNIANEYMLGSNGQTVQPMIPPIFATRQQAFRFAAWLKFMAVTLPDEEEASTFEEIEEEIMKS